MRAQEFSLGAKTERPKIEAEGRELGWGSWGGAASQSPPAKRSGERCELPVGFWMEHRRPKVFYYH